MSDIDGSEALRNLIESTISYLTWHESACQKLEFKGLSQVWQDEPAWYFWIDSIPGGILLRLHHEEPVIQNQYISLSVHYYPNTQEPVYQKLTDKEKSLINDPEIMDKQTNTPQFEAFEKCLPYFLSAEISLLISKENQLQTLILSSANGQDHPMAIFFDFLVKALNFYLKYHHTQVKQLKMPDVSSLFVIYDTMAFEQFIKIYDLDKSDFFEPIQTDMLDKWKIAAHMNAECSVNSTCACH